MNVFENRKKSFVLSARDMGLAVSPREISRAV
jgi:hypothetical protein